MSDDDPHLLPEKPTVYLIHGDDHHAINEYLHRLIGSLDNSANMSLSTTRLDGRNVSEEDVRSAAMTIPFFTSHRIVILTHALALFKAKTSQDTHQRYLSLLEKLPPTTMLILVVEDQYLGKNRGWDTLKDNHWLKIWFTQAGQRALYKLFQLPDQRKMPYWILERSGKQGGHFTQAAAEALANHVGNNTQMAHMEIDKLLTYVDFRRPVEASDVDALCNDTQVNVFRMVDAIAEMKPRLALHELHALLEQQDATSLFFMIIRQFRLLLQMREISDENDDIGSGSSDLLKSPAFVLEKMKQQAKHFSQTELEDIYHQLLGLDVAIKNGEITPELALDTFVAELVR